MSSVTVPLHKPMRALIHIYIVIAAISTLLPGLVAAQPHRIAESVYVGKKLAAGEPVKIDVVNAKSMRAISLILEWSANTPIGSEVVIRNAVGAMVYTFRYTGEPQPNTSSQMRSTFYFTATSSHGQAQPPTLLAYNAFPKARARTESGQGLCSVDPANGCDVPDAADVPAPLIKAAASSVALLSIGTHTCTGFLVDTDLLLTNFHCIEPHRTGSKYWIEVFKKSPDITLVPCQGGVEIRFEVFDGEAGGGKPWTCLKVVAFSPTHKLDFVAFQVRPDKQDDVRRPLKATNSKTDVRAFVLQHPNGSGMKVSGLCLPSTMDVAAVRAREKKMQVALDNCYKGATLPQNSVEWLSDVKLGSSLFYSRCATQTGSSGSPVLSDKGFVIGLHYAGEGTYDTTVALFAATAQCFETKLAEAKVVPLNKAIRICSVMNEIATTLKRPQLKCT